MDEIETIFGPVTNIMEFQEILYSAITYYIVCIQGLLTYCRSRSVVCVLMEDWLATDIRIYSGQQN